MSVSNTFLGHRQPQDSFDCFKPAHLQTLICFDTCGPSSLVSPHTGSLALESCLPRQQKVSVHQTIRKPPASSQRSLSTTESCGLSVSCPFHRPEHIRSLFDVIAAFTSCDYPRRNAHLRERASAVLSPNPVSAVCPHARHHAAGDAAQQ